MNKGVYLHDMCQLYNYSKCCLKVYRISNDFIL